MVFGLQNSLCNLWKKKEKKKVFFTTLWKEKLTAIKSTSYSTLIISDKECTAHFQGDIKIKLLNIFSEHGHPQLHSQHPQVKVKDNAISGNLRKDCTVWNTVKLLSVRRGCGPHPSSHLAKVKLIRLDRQQYDHGAKYSVGMEERKAGTNGNEKHNVFET